mmetsp:Transcript_59736/g.98491  ORF Transcript_59736/g.98491 Transcript_59736/m.98491 type:complete len:90 (-) Transcript_59736:839-1108(-)
MAPVPASSSSVHVAAGVDNLPIQSQKYCKTMLLETTHERTPKPHLCLLFCARNLVIGFLRTYGAAHMEVAYLMPWRIFFSVALTKENSP